MNRMKLISSRTALLAALLLTLVGLTVERSEAGAKDDLLLLPTATSAGGWCSGTDTCVELCRRLQNGTDVPQGIFCCAPQGMVGKLGVTCGDVGGIAGRYNSGPV